MAGDALIRASDADRDHAATQLREHYAAGRLNAGEHRERISATFEARTLGELRHLLADLPELAQRPARTAGPAGRSAPPQQNPPRPAALGVIVATLGVILAAYGVTGLLTGIWWIPWALIVVPAAHVIHRSRQRPRGAFPSAGALGAAPSRRPVQP
jgi:Domain of unknown function (DUF1707)